MKRVLIYSGLLLAGMAVSQSPEILPWRSFLHGFTLVCLSYIMVEVGLEFSRDEINWRRYAVDYGVAGAAAVFPWAFCAIYLATVLGAPWKDAWLVGLFAAPT